MNTPLRAKGHGGGLIILIAKPRLYLFIWMLHLLSATVPCGHQWNVYDVLGWFCGPGLGSGSGTGFLSLKGSQGVALISRGVTFFHVFF